MSYNDKPTFPQGPPTPEYSRVWADYLARQKRLSTHHTFLIMMDRAFTRPEQTILAQTVACAMLEA